MFLYGPDFFAYMNSRRPQLELFAEAIWRVVGPFATVLDLGCGTGIVIEWMRGRGAKVTGVDYYGHSKTVDIRKQSLEELVHNVTRAHLLICTETAEHLPESASTVLVNSCVKWARNCIVWSAAPPGQGGDGHVNCQPPEFWLDQFAARGWLDSREESMRLRRLMVDLHSEHCDYVDNFYVLRPDASEAR